MSSSDLSAKTLLQTIVEMAPSLREAGVLEVSFHGVCVKMAPHEPEVEQGEEPAGPDNYADPLEDPALYGGKVPTFALRGRK